MGWKLVIIVVIGVVLNLILSFLKNVMIGFSVDETRDYEARNEILDELNRKIGQKIRCYTIS